MTGIASSVRELTDAELAIVAGGGFWGDIAKLAGGVIGRTVLGGVLGATVGAAAVIVGQEIYNNYTPGQPLPSTPIEDAAI